MIDAAFFQELCPNNPRPRVTELIGTDWVLDSAREWQLSCDSSSGSLRQQVKGNGIEAVEFTEGELLICCPTVPRCRLHNMIRFRIISMRSGKS
jgi:hypothetical protein